MMALAAEDLADVRRWLISGAFVILAHGGIAAAMVTWEEPIEQAEPAGAIVVEFAPLPAAPAAPSTDVAPGPEQVMSEATPEQKTKAETEPPDMPQAPNPDVAVEPPEPTPQTPPQQEPRAPAPTTSAPQAIPQRLAAIPAAPTQGRPTLANSRALATWRTQILTLLERNKRYPPAAQSRHEQGVAQVFFILDRRGHVIESRIVHSSGAAALDAEALALLRRAQPFPPWPSGDFASDNVNLTVPIQFNLK